MELSVKSYTEVPCLDFFVHLIFHFWSRKKVELKKVEMSGRKIENAQKVNVEKNTAPESIIFKTDIIFQTKE